MAQVESKEGYLEGQLLIAMPTMADPRFARSVIYLCTHNADGAMGLVINRQLDTLTFPQLLEQLEIAVNRPETQTKVHFGGPVETGRGFVLHSADYVHEGTLVVANDIALTATVDILRLIADGEGPRQNLLALGYAGWGPGQLETEIQDNAWLNVPADPSLIFDDNLDGKWNQALAKLGIDPTQLSGAHGHA